MNKTQIFFKRHTPLILTTLSTIGVITTTVLGIKATPKATKLIEFEEEQQKRKLTKLEKVKVAWKPYIPTMISGFSTIFCILGNHIFTAKTQASLVSAYMALDNMHKEYVQKVEELYGNEADDKIKQEILLDNSYQNPLDSDKQLFFDYQSMRYFESSVDEVLAAEDKLNETFAATGFVTINEFYRLLGISGLTYGNDVGWYAPNDYFELEFEHQKVELDTGLYVYLINMVTPPCDLVF